MTHMPTTRELHVSDRRDTIVDAAWHRIVTLATNPDLLAVVLFCVVGLGLTINVLVRHPDFALVVDQFDMFP